MKTHWVVWLVLAIIVGYFLFKTHHLDAFLDKGNPLSGQGA